MHPWGKGHLTVLSRTRHHRNPNVPLSKDNFKQEQLVQIYLKFSEIVVRFLYPSLALFPAPIFHRDLIRESTASHFLRQSGKVTWQSTSSKMKQRSYQSLFANGLRDQV